MFACDQDVIYIPAINVFVLVMQTTAFNYVLAVASPEEVTQTGGRNWTTYLLRASSFGTGPANGDYPKLSFGDTGLYLTFNRNGAAAHAVAVRLELAHLADRTTQATLEFLSAKKNSWLVPAQNIGATALFVANDSTSQLAVFQWHEGEHVYDRYTVPIATIPTEDFEVAIPGLPNGPRWLASTNKIGCQVKTATRSGNQLWVAWTGARRNPGAATNTFPYPHVGVAVIDLTTRTLAQMRYVYHTEFAFAWPSLTTNSTGDVGLCVCWGGNKTSPHIAVMTLTGPNQQCKSISSGDTNGAGGHFTTIRPGSPDNTTFCAAASQQTREPLNHPFYVEFTP